MILMGSIPSPAWAAGPTHSVRLTVTQTFTTASTTADDTFTYRLTAVDPGHPMPMGGERLGAFAGSVLPATGPISPISPDRSARTLVDSGLSTVGDPTVDGHVFTISGSRDVSIDPIAYDRAGVYEYTLAQVINPPRAGYIYDQRVYRVQVHVPDDPGQPAVVIARDSHPTGVKVERIQFDNSFDPAFGPDPPSQTDPPGPPIPPGPPTGGGSQPPRPDPTPSPTYAPRAPTGGRVG
ncbi:MAG: hypothetical protein LBV00_12120 [Propionibacteriaceae bacterium]|nr:hypothetical protein [Propionibacteriaceae bacterium]